VRRELDAPGALAFRRFVQLRYGDHPWSLPPGGTLESLESLSREHLRQALAERMRRDDAVLCLVGDVEPEATADRMTTLLEALPAGAAPVVAPAAPCPPDRAVLERVPSRRALAHLVVGFPAPAAGDPDGPALDLLHKLLSGQSGRLFRELRDREGLAYQVGSTGTTGIDPGWFAVYLATDPGKVEQARSSVHRELDRLVSEPLDEEELNIARAALQGSFEIGRQSYGAVVDARVADALCGLGWRHTDGFCDRLDQVTVEELGAAARRIIDLSRPIEVVAGPLDTEG
jgi:zinc protease